MYNDPVVRQFVRSKLCEQKRKKVKNASDECNGSQLNTTIGRSQIDGRVSEMNVCDTTHQQRESFKKIAQFFNLTWQNFDFLGKQT